MMKKHAPEEEFRQGIRSRNIDPSTHLRRA